ncbi:MAG TPA: FGGY family carbohydrate kinase [Longimicrobiales bacterium]
MPDALLGIDIGTSAAKALLLDLDGREIATASQSYPLLTPQPGWVEQDPEAVWQALCAVLREIVSQAGDHRTRSVSLALAAQAGSIIPADLAGDPVYPMLTWLDGRAQDLMRQWQADGTAAAIRRLSGWQPFAGLPLPSIGWLRQHRPDVHAAAARWLGPADFLIHRLTGEFATDQSAASEMLLVDVRTAQWSDALCAIGGLDPARQSRIVPSGRLAGALTPEAARLTGLPAGTPVIAGGNDQPCAGLAMGMTVPGKVMLSTGTAWVMMSVVDTPSSERVPAWVNVYLHAVPGAWLQGQLVGGFGATVDWWVRQTWPPAEGGPLRYEPFNAAVQASPPGSQGLLFLSLSGPSQVLNPAGGGGFAGLTLAHTRNDMSRAVLEGCAYEVRWALDELRAAGIAADELWLAGGATRSPVWPQILADVSGVPVVLAGEADWAALGGAMLAGWGAGAFPTLEAAIARLQPRVARLTPNPALAGLYAEQLAVYQRVSRAVSAAR